MPVIPFWRMRALGLPPAQLDALDPIGEDAEGDPLYDEASVRAALEGVLRGCQWIEGDPRGRWRYCARPRLKGSYCLSHSVQAAPFLEQSPSPAATDYSSGIGPDFGCRDCRIFVFADREIDPISAPFSIAVRITSLIIPESPARQAWK